MGLPSGGRDSSNMGIQFELVESVWAVPWTTSTSRVFLKLPAGVPVNFEVYFLYVGH